MHGIDHCRGNREMAIGFVIQSSTFAHALLRKQKKTNKQWGVGKNPSSKAVAASPREDIFNQVNSYH